MAENLEKSLRETASKLAEIFKKGKCTEKIKEYVLDGEKVYECPKCFTLNVYEIGPTMKKCDSCGDFYEYDNLKQNEKSK